MTLVDEEPTTSRALPHPHHDTELVHGLLVTAVFGTSSGVSLQEGLHSHALEVTTVRSTCPSDLTVADEVRRLRDDIAERGLTRQDIARGIGVDRRSLSGYASGEINPQPQRMEALRMLDRVTREVDADRPRRARYTLLASRGNEVLLDSIASGNYAQALAWRTWIDRLEASNEVRPRFVDSEPMWSAAAKAFVDGRLTAPSRAETLRSSDVYEMDVTEASAFEEEESQTVRRRPNYR